MLDIEAKLSSFRKMVWDEEKEKTDQELFQSSERNSSFLDSKNESRKEDFEKKVKDRDVFLEIRKNEEISKISQDEKNRFFAYKEQLLDDFYEKLTDKLKAYRKTSDYKDKLQKEIEGKIKSLGLNEDEIIVAVVDEDLILIDFKHTESIEKTNIGGFMLIDINKEFRYNFTYRQKIRENKYEFGKKLYQVLESESFNESKN
ncbi:ATPase [Anaerococcus degeneri]|uniref:ATPase n=1 Tax=Anaerococcus degeneri TaxID=361500 RepID=A0ABS7YVC2_9FIRM|nr:ATPase [Anaerococcus degeneri]MBP2015100.1 V/A-type H+-transporting ATPase subunit E [Anaerococcus degeneri]MCA2095360.1 ATPase [Anaerococcus degeneri]